MEVAKPHQNSNQEIGGRAEAAARFFSNLFGLTAPAALRYCSQSFALILAEQSLRAASGGPVFLLG